MPPRLEDFSDFIRLQFRDLLVKGDFPDIL
jgi:hypothetical protein